MNQQLSMYRMYYLARRDIIQRWRSLAIGAGAVFGAMVLMAMLEILATGHSNMDYSSYFFGVLLIWGCIDASMAFLSLQSKSGNEAFLMLPASTLEKVLVRLLFTSLVLPLGILLLVFAGSLFSEGIAVLLNNSSFAPLRLFEAGNFKAIGHLIIGQSVFFLGATWFKKAHLVKTILSLIIIGIGFVFASVALFWLIYGSYFREFFDSRDMGLNMAYFLHSRYSGYFDTLWFIGKVLFYGLLAPFCWFVAWLRVKETESSDGI